MWRERFSEEPPQRRRGFLSIVAQRRRRDVEAVLDLDLTGRARRSFHSLRGGLARGGGRDAAPKHARGRARCQRFGERCLHVVGHVGIAGYGPRALAHHLAPLRFFASRDARGRPLSAKTCLLAVDLSESSCAGWLSPRRTYGLTILNGNAELKQMLAARYGTNPPLLLAYSKRRCGAEETPRRPRRPSDPLPPAKTNREPHARPPRRPRALAPKDDQRRTHTTNIFIERPSSCASRPIASRASR